MMASRMRLRNGLILMPIVDLSGQVLVAILTGTCIIQTL